MTDELKNLTSMIEELPEKVPVIHACGNTKTYQTGNGKTTGKGLMRNPECDVCLLEMEVNASTHKHVDTETEIFIVISGKIEITYDENITTILKKGNSLTIKPGIPHTVKCIENAIVLAVAIPSNAAFPDGPKIF